MSVPGDMPEVLVFRGFEALERMLRASFEVVDAEGRSFVAWADLTPEGVVVDLHASDLATVGSTGRPEVDHLVRRRAEAELTRARSAAIVADFDRRRRRWGAA